MAVRIPGIPFALSKSLESRRAKLDGEMSQHETKLAEFRESAAELSAKSLSWDEGSSSLAERLKVEKLDLLNREIYLRGQLDELLADVEIAKGEATSVACAAHAKLMAELRQAMEQLGFVFAFDGDEPIGPCKVALMAHPKIRAANESVGSITAWSTRDNRRENRQQIERLENELAGQRQRALAALA